MPFDGTQLTPIAAHLLRAKHLIEKNGWTRGPGRPGHQRCPYYAILDTNADSHIPVAVLRMFEQSITDQPHYSPGEAIWQWADAPWRSTEEIFVAFDQAIAFAIRSRA